MFGKPTARSQGRRALDALDKALAAKPEKDGHAFSETTEHLCRMRDILIARQDQDGSWDPKDEGPCKGGGRILTTSLSLLSLQVYYRHMPLYQRDDPKK